MAYNGFAWFYDEFNGEADYDALYRYVVAQFEAHGIREGIVADLGCGTGDLTLMLTQAGYDMIGVDQSEEMLAVLQEKAAELGLSGQLLLLHQDLLSLDLYGTIRAAVSTFDTLNHIGPADRFFEAVRRAGFFMEEGGVFIFDLNTPYKHREVLGEREITLEVPDAVCRWQNHYDPAAQRVDIALDILDEDTGEHWREQFSEYSYTLDQVQRALDEAGFALESVLDGERFAPLMPDSQRTIITAVKRYTQTGR